MADPWQSKAFADDSKPPIRLKKPGEYALEDIHSERDQWAVYLPHSCDEWVIAAEADKFLCVGQLSRFIAALEKVRDELVQAQRPE